MDTLRRSLSLAERADDLREQAVSSRHLSWSLGQLGRYEEAVDTLRRALSLAERAGDAAELAWTACQLVNAARKIGDDATAVTAWQRVLVAVALAPAHSNPPDIASWFDDAAVAALRSGQFDVVWSTTAKLRNTNQWSIEWAAPHSLASTVAEVNRAQGRAAAYALAAHCIEVLAQDAAARAMRNEPVGLDPIAFLRRILSGLARQVTDPALLRDIGALLEKRLPSETEAERALLEAAARRAENPTDPAALERVDPDIARVLELMFGAAPKPVSKTSPRRGKRRSEPPRPKRKK